MSFPPFSTRWTVLAAVFFSFLLSASHLRAEPKPLEDATKLTKPTICYQTIWGLRLIDWDGQNNRAWIEGVFRGPAQWSRDGQRASMLDISGAADLLDLSGYAHYILDLTTGRMTNITDRLNDKGVRGIYYVSASWFPNGRQLACLGYTSPDSFSDADIYILNLKTLTLANITNSPKRHEQEASVSWDGKKIAFHAQVEMPNPAGERHADIYSMNADGSGIVNLTNTPRLYENDPEWSPDGKKIAFRALIPFVRPDGTEGFYREIHVMNVDGTNRAPLVSEREGQVIYASSKWSPDSKWLLFSLMNRGDIDIYRVHVKKKEIVRVTHDRSASGATWVLAGKSRFLSINPAGKINAQWGAVKEAGGIKNNQTPQDSGE